MRTETNAELIGAGGYSMLIAQVRRGRVIPDAELIALHEAHSAASLVSRDE